MNSKKVRNHMEEGITLIALVVTIIVLLILAGITIYFAFGQNGLLNRTEMSREEVRASQVQEERDLWMADVETDNILGTHNAKSVNQIITELVSKKLLTENEEDIILGNEEKGIFAEGEITIANKRIVFKEIFDARGNGNLDAGTGTEDDPYLIQSIEDLVTLSYNVSPSSGAPQFYNNEIFKLTVNLDFNSRDSYIDPDRTDFGDVNEDGQTNTLIEEMTTSNGFRPIGKYSTSSSSYPFQGSINGNNKKIKNLHMGENANRLGMIGFIAGSNSTIKNLTLENISNSGSTSYGIHGGLIAITSGANVRIENCNMTGKIEREFGNSIGGFIGATQGGNIVFENDTNDVYMYAINSIGGYLGKVQGSTVDIKNCYSKGTINAQESASKLGGFVGEYASGPKITIEGSTNELSVAGMGYNSIGGYLGKVEGGTVDIKNCYSKGTINTQDSASKLGGFVGEYASGPKITIEGSTNELSVAGMGYYGGFCGYVNSTEVSANNCRNKGNMFCNSSGGHGTGGVIGCLSAGKSDFINCVSECNEIQSGYDGSSAGIVGQVESCDQLAVNNCHNYSNIISRVRGAGIIGRLKKASSILIQNCHNSGEIGRDKGTYDNAGIAGTILECEEMQIKDSYNEGKITGLRRIGGIIGSTGYPSSGSINKCYNIGEIIDNDKDSARYYIGGILGNTTDQIQISDCFNSGKLNTVTCEKVGGIAGETKGDISHCYNLGEVIGKNKIGGIVGEGTGTISYCYNANSIKGISYIGGVAGVSSSINNSFNLGRIIVDNSGETNERIGSISGECADNTYNAYLATTYNIGSGEDNYSDAETTTKRVDSEQELCTLICSKITGDNWEIKAGEKLPTLKITNNF